LVIDAGTAITYDFATANGEYKGGGIAPGMAMRFRALHEFTARLPLVSSQSDVLLIGDSTTASIQSGVQWGIIAEVEGMISYYKSQISPDLQVFLTGGDSGFFENHLKNINFADSNLILKGIHYILTR
ncbi:MAG: type III pantothenate kinase, partial [Bacteroidetes bacterium]|nr:type III pantothenate kinase [Bacteroidota bacterium]